MSSDGNPPNNAVEVPCLIDRKPTAGTPAKYHPPSSTKAPVRTNSLRIGARDTARLSFVSTLSSLPSPVSRSAPAVEKIKATKVPRPETHETRSQAGDPPSGAHTVLVRPTRYRDSRRPRFAFATIIRTRAEEAAENRAIPVARPEYRRPVRPLHRAKRGLDVPPA